MVVSKVAKRYAMALFYEAKSQDALHEVAGDMIRMNQSLSASRELQRFVRSQVISREKKTSVLGELFENGSHPVTRQFIHLILEKKRESHLQGITRAFDVLFKKEQGIIEVEVYVVKTPGPEQELHLKKAIEQKTGKKVDLRYTEDPSIMGGMAIRLEDTVIDGTVKHKLQQLESIFQHAGE